MDVGVDRVAARSLKEMGTPAEHLVEHHQEHMGRVARGACSCELGRDGMTAMRAPDGTVLVISEAGPDDFFISGHPPGGS